MTRMFFRSKERETVETVKAKLDAAIAEKAAADQALKEAALAAALSSDPLAAEPHREALRRAREKVELLHHAVAAAEEVERQAIAKAKADLRKSQNRSIRQKLALLFKEARRLEDAEAIRVAAFASIVQIGRDIQKLIPTDDREFQFFSTALSNTRLSDEVQDETNRLSALQFGKYEPLRVPGAHHPPIGFDPWSMPGLTARLETKLLPAFQHLVGRAPPPLAVPGAEQGKITEPMALPPPARRRRASAATEPTPAVREQQGLPFDPTFSNVLTDDPEGRRAFMVEVELLRSGRPPAQVEVVPIDAADMEDAEPVEVEPIDDVAADPVIGTTIAESATTETVAGDIRAEPVEAEPAPVDEPPAPSTPY